MTALQLVTGLLLAEVMVGRRRRGRVARVAAAST
jgi:hypothetical protein